MVFRQLGGLTLALSLIALPAEVVGQRLEFEAASVKIDKSPFVPRVRNIEGPGSTDPGRIVYRRMPIGALINQAYEVIGDQLYGPTGKLREDLYSGDGFAVTATFPPTTTKAQFRIMLQNLLADRFHLVLHHETRDYAGYDVVVADGGPKFHRWVPDPNVSPRLAGRPLEPGQSGFYFRPTRNPPMVHVTNRQSIAEFIDEGLQSMAVLAENTRGDPDENLHPRTMPTITQKPLFVDKTGLSGEFEFDLDFEGAMIPSASAGGPTLSEALEKQLGLKLVKVKRIPVDVLVIDHVDKVPAEN
jgi:uncharacterized protein (TIGR03435 family)